MLTQDSRLFLRRWLKSPKHVGAIAPSSRRLADAMARLVPANASGWVIELGGGTGAITAALLRAGVRPARLAVIERDPLLHRLLSERFPSLQVILGDAARLAEAVKPLGIRRASAIVSGLPLLTFPRALQDEIVRGAFGLLAPGAPFIQFTYGPLSPVGRKRLNLEGVLARRIIGNLPPASIWVYRRAGESSQAM
ncbi:MAG TPA: ribose ABC transporter permease [Dongiaceae bacterium]|nr:ribose ABC transporter permease [Dongiaceae bacterium]